MRQQPCGLLCGWPICKRLGIMPPDSMTGLVIDMTVALAVAYTATFTPMQVAFYENFDSMPWHVINVVAEILFMLSIAFRFRRGFNYDGVRVFDPHFIALHYLRGEFVTDFIAAFPCVCPLPTPIHIVKESLTRDTLTLERLMCSQVCLADGNSHIPRPGWRWTPCCRASNAAHASRRPRHHSGDP